MGQVAEYWNAKLSVESMVSPIVAVAAAAVQHLLPTPVYKVYSAIPTNVIETYLMILYKAPVLRE